MADAECCPFCLYGNNVNINKAIKLNDTNDDAKHILQTYKQDTNDAFNIQPKMLTSVDIGYLVDFCLVWAEA